MRREVRTERLVLSRPLRTAAFERREVDVLVVELEDGDHRGRGEVYVHERSGFTHESERQRAKELPLAQVATASASPALDALDAALLDLEAKRAGQRAWEVLGVEVPGHVATMMTLSLDRDEVMAHAAREAAGFTTLKLKSDPAAALARVRAVREARPDARLVVDGNESWSADDVRRLGPELAALGVALLEQPLPAGGDDALTTFAHALPICADESAPSDAPVASLAGRYDAINVKLPKAGGLRRALRQIADARAHGLQVFVGCMVSSSLAIAPGWVAATQADFVDLDGALHLADDRTPGMPYEGERLGPPPRALWG